MDYTFEPENSEVATWSQPVHGRVQFVWHRNAGNWERW